MMMMMMMMMMMIFQPLSLQNKATTDHFCALVSLATQMQNALFAEPKDIHKPWPQGKPPKLQETIGVHF